MSILETVRKVQEAEREAEAVLAAARMEAEEEILRASGSAERILASALEAAQGELERLRARIADEEAASLMVVATAGLADRENVRGRAGRNHPAAVALLRELVEDMARGDGDPWR